MILIYLDESGINYKTEKGLFQDSPFLLFGAMLIREDVYWNMERLFIDLINKYFGIDNWIDNEVHATDIWSGKSLSSKLSTEQRREFFNEFLQLCSKFEIPYIFSIRLKTFKQTSEERNIDFLKNAQSLLINIEHKLAGLHQTGVLVCDSSQSIENCKIKDINNLDIKTKNFSPGQALLKIFYQMTSWRLTNKKLDGDIKPRYSYEAKSAYLIDRVHFLHSDDSLFLQICDIMTFLIQRGLVYEYLLTVDNAKADINKVPYDALGINMMVEKIFPCMYSDSTQDVVFCHSGGTESTKVFDFERAGLGDDLKKHYELMQSIV
jgi:hypothetical protein